jgi:hypothetical protein
MSYARKQKGFRNIVVEGARYRWCLRTGIDYYHVVLQGALSEGQQAIVAMRGSRDPWLSISEGRAELVIMTPKTVRLMIQQALAAGWQPAQPREPLKINYQPPA